MVEPSERGRIEQWLLLKVDRLGKLAHREATGPNREDGKIRGNSFCIYSLGPALPLGSGLRARETPGPSVQRFTAFEAQASESPVVGPSPAPPQTPGSERPLRSDHGSWASGRPSDSGSQPSEPGSWQARSTSGQPLSNTTENRPPVRGTTAQTSQESKGMYGRGIYYCPYGASSPKARVERAEF